MLLFKNLKFKYKILTSNILIFVFVFSVSGLLSYSLIKNSISQKINRELEKNSQQMIDYVESTINTTISNYLRAITEKNKDIVEGYYKKVVKKEISLQTAKKDIRDILLSQKIGKTGYLFVWDISKAPKKIPLAIHPQIEGEDVSSVNFVQQGAKIKTGFLQYKWKNPNDPNEREKVMYLSYFKPWNWVIAASAYRSEFLYLINYNVLKKRILNLKFEQTDYTYVLDSKGSIVFHPSYSKGTSFYDIKDFDGKFFIKEICNKKNGSIIYKWKNPNDKFPSNRIAVYRYYPAFDWIVASTSYLDEVYALLYRSQNIFLITTIIAIVFLIFISIIISTSITRPINTFINKLEKGIEIKDYNVRIDMDGNDELSDLARYFNSFMSQLSLFYDELITSEEKFRALAENNIDTIMRFDTHLRHLYVNPIVEKITGLPAENFIGKTHRELGFPPDLVDLWENTLNKVLETKEVTRIEFILPSNAWIDWLLVPELSKTGEVVAIITSARDITEKKKIQDIMINHEKMLSLASMAAGIAHEINTPLSIISTSIENISRRLSKDLKANYEIANSYNIDLENLHNFLIKRKIFDYVSKIKISCTNSSEIIQNMLNFSRLKKEKSKANINELIKETITFLSYDSQLRKNYNIQNITIKTNFSDQLPIIACYKSELQQVFINLIKNSIFALTEKKTAIKDYQPTIVVSTTKEKNSIIITIKDNGPGIPDEIKKNIFSPFYTTKPKGEGTGLGLSVSSDIIKAHHQGDISVDTKKGEWTQFTICIPVQLV